MIPIKQITFGYVIDKIPNQILNSTYNKDVIREKTVVYLNDIYEVSHYKWLKEFKANEFNALNEKRVQIVHYTNIESEYFQQYAKYNTNADELTRLQKEKEGLVDLFLNEYANCLKGFEEMLSLIDLLP